jgi:putative hydrolase of the HAD superfamily
MNKIKAILFDLDDTLLDDTKATLKYRRQFYDNHQGEIPFSFDAFYRIWEQQVIADLANLAKGASSILDSRRNRMRIVFGKTDMAKTEADGYIEEYLSLYKDSWEIYDDAIPSLTKLQDKYRLGIVTNGDKQQQFQKINKFNLQKYFEVIVSCEDAQATKPERRIFDYSSSRLGLGNFECLFIGDGYEKDAVGSRDAGMKSVWLKRDGKLSDKPLDRISIINSLFDIAKLLEMLK